MQLPAFRQSVISAVQAATHARPLARLHLLYAPELADPLSLRESTARETALMHPPKPWRLRGDQLPRVITLDCRQVAAFLLETDPGLDDPLFEASISRAHAEVFGGAALDPTLRNDDPHATRRGVCGWIVSSDSAQAIAHRIGRFSHQHRNGPRWLRWHDPDRFEHIWPTLDAHWREVVLGDDATWVAPGAQGEIVCYASPAASEIASAPTDDKTNAEQLTPAHWAVIDHVPIVNDLRERWRGMLAEDGKPLPHDAIARLHSLVAQAREHGFDGGDLAIYVLTAVQLRPGATRSAPFTSMLQRLRAEGGDLRHGLHQLDEPFWNHYALP
ncbi:MAG TPA: hypothetical protein VFS42_02255 [Burkholderiaceae bacterium]|nr:hypothetical protein [Burkholderiaceae bacterium]